MLLRLPELSRKKILKHQYQNVKCIEIVLILVKLYCYIGPSKIASAIVVDESRLLLVEPSNFGCLSMSDQRFMQFNNMCVFLDGERTMFCTLNTPDTEGCCIQWRF